MNDLLSISKFVGTANFRLIEKLPTCLHLVTEPAEVRQHFRVLVSKMLAGLATLPDFL